jgi:tetratricopeptide (TPR) repeat protein
VKCPICDRVNTATALRCPQCNQPLTVWLNFDRHAQNAYAAGLALLAEGETNGATDHLWRAAIFAPHNAQYLATFGKVRARQGRYEEALFLLEKAQSVSPNEATAAALSEARTALQPKERSDPTDATATDSAKDSEPAEKEAELPE